MFDRTIGKYLGIAGRAYSTIIDKKLCKYKITHGLVPLLIYLYNKEGVNQDTLCKNYNVNKAVVSKGIVKLENAGYVMKKVSLNDRRNKLIYLTKKAQDFKPVFEQIIKEIEDEVKQGIPKQELDTFFSVVQSLCLNLGINIKSINWT